MLVVCVPEDWFADLCPASLVPALILMVGSLPFFKNTHKLVYV